MSHTPELPNIGGNNPRDGINSDSDLQNQMVWAESPQNQQIIWEESDDVYKPIPQKIKDFKSARGIEEGGSLKKVYIKADALQTLTAHLGSNLQIEQGGILFGNAYQDPTYGIYVEITAAVPAPATIGTGAHLDFTPESWLGIMDYAKHQHPEENIVGWYHSHPNIGVFMSGTDKNTQRAFFSHPWCLSIVCDPVRRTIGYFLGESAILVQPVIWPHPIEMPPSQPAQDQYSFTPPQKNITSLPNRPEIPQEETVNQEGDNQQDQSSNISPTKPQKKGYPLSFVLWVAFLVALVAVVIGGVIGKTIWSNYNQNITSESSTPPVVAQPSLQVDAYIMTMPAKFFEEFQNRNPFKYLVVKPPGKIGTGDEIALLAIALPEERENADRFQLEIQTINLTEDLPLANNAVSIDSLNNIADLGNKNSTNHVNLTPTPLQLETLSKYGLVFILIYSSHPGKNDEAKDDKKDDAKEAKRVVREVIYLPRKLIYRDRENNQQEIELSQPEMELYKIIKYGDQPR